MKLSEITGSRAIDVVAELIQPLANIAGDREIIGKLFDTTPKGDESRNDAASRRLKENIPVLLKSHNADILKILSIINDQDPDSISVPEIVKGALDLIGDEDFMALFMSAVPKGARQQPGKSSGEAGVSEPES